MPSLSIITVNLNNCVGLQKTIESVVNQNYFDYEYIVIDGGSTDESVKIIKENAGKITYWVSEPDLGIYNAMNKGISKANGEYLQFLNSGDWLSDVSVLSKVFEIPRSVDIIYGHMNFVSCGNKNLRLASDESQFSLSYFFFNSLCHPAVFFAKRLFKNNLYDESYRIAADKKLFVEKIIFQNCTLQKIDLTIANFNTDGITNQQWSKELVKEENERIFSELIPPRMFIDVLLFKNNYNDIKALVKIKRHWVLFLIFKGLRKTSTLFQKYLHL